MNWTAVLLALGIAGAAGGIIIGLIAAGATGTTPPPVGLTIVNLASAALIGIGGARLVTSELAGRASPC